MVVFFVTGLFLPVDVVSFAFLRPTAARSFARIERSEALRLRAPLTMSAGFSPGLVLGGIGVVVGLENAASNIFRRFIPLISI